uniref:Ig-like domain-containing protein n=1 Tax=Monodelphis domestica TaxID=13616 RepID=F6Z1C3_MONDO
MTWALLLCPLFISGASSQAVVLSQESSLSMSPGGSVTMTCGSSTGPVTTSHYSVWVQQKSGHVPLGLIGGTTTRYPGIPARFSGSILGNKAALTITGAQPEDEAEYYCALWFSKNWVFIQGSPINQN